MNIELPRMEQNQDQPPINRKTKYYLAHKDEESFKIRMREAKQRYYQKNREALIEKALTRYYTLKQGQPDIVQT